MDANALIGGAINGAIFAGVAYALSRHTQQILAGTLIAAALVYVHFAADGQMARGWLAIEAGGVALYGAMALLGVRRSAMSTLSPHRAPRRDDARRPADSSSVPAAGLPGGRHRRRGVSPVARSGSVSHAGAGRWAHWRAWTLSRPPGAALHLTQKCLR